MNANGHEVENIKGRTMQRSYMRKQRERRRKERTDVSERENKSHEEVKVGLSTGAHLLKGDHQTG
jgi:hypothetical protein